MPSFNTTIVFAFILASLMAVWGWSTAGSYQTQAEFAEQRAAAAEAALKTVRTNLRTVSSQYATSELRLRQVLASTPDRATPRPVYDELCRRANCAKPGPVPTPAD